jgi:hypothetical protein
MFNFLITFTCFKEDKYTLFVLHIVKHGNLERGHFYVFVGNYELTKNLSFIVCFM